MVKPEEVEVRPCGWLPVAAFAPQIDSMLRRPWHDHERERYVFYEHSIPAAGNWGNWERRQIVMHYRSLGWLCRPSVIERGIVFGNPRQRLTWLGKRLPYWLV